MLPGHPEAKTGKLEFLSLWQKLQSISGNGSSRTENESIGQNHHHHLRQLSSLSSQWCCIVYLIFLRSIPSAADKKQGCSIECEHQIANFLFEISFQAGNVCKRKTSTICSLKCLVWQPRSARTRSRSNTCVRPCMQRKAQSSAAHSENFLRKTAETEWKSVFLSHFSDCPLFRLKSSFFPSLGHHFLVVHLPRGIDFLATL